MWHQKELGITIRELMASGASKDEILRELSPGGERYISENGKILTIRSYIGQLFPRRKKGEMPTEPNPSSSQRELLNQCLDLLSEQGFEARLSQLVTEFQAIQQERQQILAQTHAELGKLSLEELKALHKHVLQEPP